MNNLFVARDLSSSPDFALPDISDLNNFVLPPIRPSAQRNQDNGIRNHMDTLRDVESAFHNADLALRNAREALDSDTNMSGRIDLPSMSRRGGGGDSQSRGVNNTNNDQSGHSNVVDLTSLSSDTSNEEVDAQRLHNRQSNIPVPRHPRNLARHSAIRSRPSTLELDRPFQIFPPSWTQMGFGTRPLSNHRIEESAIRRQRQARRSWERVERRNRERAAEQAQLDAIERARISATETANNTALTRPRRSSSNSSATSLSLDSEYSLGSEDTAPTTNPNTQTTQNTVGSHTMTAADPIDLTSLEEQSTLNDVLSRQQQAAIESQKPLNTPRHTKPNDHATSLSTYRCAICMDTPTTATTTICGHLFCHTCLKDSLKWSAQQRRDDAGLHGRRQPTAGTGLCPVCRKVLSDKEGGTKPGIVGLEIRTISRGDWERRKKQQQTDEEREDFLRSINALNAESDKGKEREIDKGKDRDRDDGNKSEIKSEDISFGISQFSTGKSTRKRRRDEAGEYDNIEGF